jgi:signal transduction histidine kinase
MESIKVELHDMANLLTRLDAYCKLQRWDRVCPTASLIVSSFYRLKRKAFSDSTPIRMESISIRDKVEYIKKNAALISAAYAIEIAVITESCSLDDRFFGFEETCETLFSNLIQNAAKAGANKVTIEYVSKPHIIMAVLADNGKGMSEEELENLGFVDYGNDRGHGVWLIRNAVNSVGGVCDWDSKLGEGTKCKVKFRRDTNAYPGPSYR